MTETVHEILLHGGPVRVLLFHVAWLEQAEFKQLLRHVRLGFLLPGLREQAGAQRIRARAQHAQHGVVDLPLAAGKFSAHGNRARHVGVVVCVGRTDIEQQKLAGFQFGGIFLVVQAARIFPTRHDRLIREAPASADELVRELRLHVGLRPARLREPQHAAERLLRELARTRDDLGFALTFHEPELVHERREAAQVMHREAVPHLAHEAVVARLHLGGRALVLVRVQENVLRLAREPAKCRPEILRPLHGLDASELLRLILAQLVAFPHFVVLVRLADEEHLAQLLVVGVGENDEQRLLLLDPGEVEEIAVRAHEQRAVGVRRQDVVRVQHRDGFRRQQLRKARAVFGEELGVERFVAHGRGVQRAKAKAQSSKCNRRRIQPERCSPCGEFETQRRTRRRRGSQRACIKLHAPIATPPSAELSNPSVPLRLKRAV